MSGVVVAALAVGLHVTSGPGEQAIGIRWAPDTNELARRAAERRWRLEAGEASPSGTWVYRPRDRSRETIRQIVTHPLVADTNHIDRNAFRVLIDAPGMPRPVRWALELNLAPIVALVCVAFAIVVAWPIRRELGRLGETVRLAPGVELGSAVVIMTVGFVYFLDNGHGVDENIHYDQIVRIVGGDWSLNPALTMLPGYHAAIALLAWPAGASARAVRVATFALSVVSVLVFHALARRVRADHAGTRTLQFALLPILFPQFFLVYTDVASLLCVLLMMVATTGRRYRTAGLLGLVACIVRQDNVVWAAFAVCWSYLREHGWRWRPVRESLARYWTFVLTGVAFIVFVALNHGQVALGNDVGSHPTGSLHIGNVVLILAFSGVTFAPLWWGYRGAMAAGLSRWWPWAVVAALFAVYWTGFVIDHPHNNERADYFLPNAVLQWAVSTPGAKIGFFLPVAFGVVAFATAPLGPWWWLLYPFAVLFLLPEWLIAPRYCIIPVALFLAAREPTHPWSERTQTVVCAALSLVSYLVIERGWGWI